MARYIFIGDFSGLSSNLFRGLSQLQYNTEMYSNGDSWKKISKGIPLYNVGDNKVYNAYQQVKGAIQLSKKISSGDTLVLSSEFIFNRFLNSKLLNVLINRAKSTIMIHAGCSSEFHKVMSETVLCKQCKIFDIKSNMCIFDEQKWAGIKGTLDKIDRIVPFTAVYEESAKLYDSSYVTESLNFPVVFDRSNVKDSSSFVTGYFHGINRLGFKGTQYLMDLTSKSSILNELITMDGKLPLSKYIEVLKSYSCLIDQLFGNGYGMNGALALSYGIPVIYGYHDAVKSSYFSGEFAIPVEILNEDIADQLRLEKLLTKYMSREYKPADVFDFGFNRHDHLKVATRFIEIINE